MKQGINLLALLLFALLPAYAHASEPISVDVPRDCTVVDADGVSHAFPQSDSPSEYLGICMLEAAREAGRIGFTLTNDPSFGLYIQSVNGGAPGATEYWAIWVNGAMASCGIGCIPLLQGDTLALVLTDWMTNAEGATVTLVASSLASPPLPPPPPGDGGGGGIPNSRLDIEAALAYLASRQSEDGSFGSPMLSDWAAIAFAAADPAGDAKAKLRSYLQAAAPSLSSVTDYERHAMALSALGINPYSGASADYIAPITSAFDGTQIGDPALDNDDVFALFPLLAAGYSTYDEIIQKTTAFILSRQKQDGSWDGSVDMTAAAIQALVQVRMLPDVSLALIRAEGYLRSARPSDSFSASWARQAIAALSWTPSGWAPSAFTEDDRLAALQQADGGVEPESSGTETRVWATAYAVPAALGKSWPMLLQSFMKPSLPEAGEPEAASTTEAAPAAPAAPIEAEEPDMPPPQAAPVPAPAEEALTGIELPVLANGQSAAAAGAPIGAFFSRLWSSAVSLLTAFF